MKASQRLPQLSSELPIKASQRLNANAVGKGPHERLAVLARSMKAMYATSVQLLWTTCLGSLSGR
jgi:hypothetical protein